MLGLGLQAAPSCAGEEWGFILRGGVAMPGLQGSS